MRLAIVSIFVLAGCAGRVAIGEHDPAADTGASASDSAAIDTEPPAADTAAVIDTATAPDTDVDVPPPTIEPRSIAVGFQHGCALDGARVRCWGANGRGQLGDGTTTDRLTPVTVTGLPDAVEVAAGGNSSCALTTDDRVFCWGDNRYSQLGESPGSAPRKVLDGASRIAVGADYACAIVSGTPHCWGKNSYAALGHVGGVACGDGELCDPKPTAVKIAAAVDIAPGFASTCALGVTGAAWCWGRNHFGQLGDGTTVDRVFPVRVAGFQALSIGVAASHACAALYDGTVRCWGGNSAGKLGYTVPSKLAKDPCSLVAVEPWFSAFGIQVPGVTDAVSIAAGVNHTCLKHRDGTLSCWGSNIRGELGNGGSTSTGEHCRSIPAKLAVASKQVAAGNAFTCATSASGVQCWGSNLFGQIGDGTTIDRSSPSAVKW